MRLLFIECVVWSALALMGDLFVVRGGWQSSSNSLNTWGYKQRRCFLNAENERCRGVHQQMNTASEECPYHDN
jgi:hypothetical protein